MKKHIAIIGLGYVGLPLALLAAEKGHQVTGVDSVAGKIDTLKAGASYIDDISDERVAQTTAHFTTDFTAITEAECIMLCVPTPVTEAKVPDLTPLEGAIRAIAPYVTPGKLVIVESTINPGVCDDVVIPLLESTTGLTVGKDIDVVHCPERINPGDIRWNVRNINRVIGGSSDRAVTRGVELYSTIIEADIKPMGSLKEAEAVKVVENSFRDINIAFVNELAMAFHKLGINLENVIDGAATKPFAFMPHRPGCGVGGHCIPVDPYYLIEYSRSHGFEHRFLNLARTINEGMPAFTVDLLREAVEAAGNTMDGYKVAMLGLSYKANVGDDRESPAYAIRQGLESAHVDLAVFDPFITERSTVINLEEALQHADALVLTAAHDAFTSLTPTLLAEHGIKVIVDGRNMLRAERQALRDAGITYVGIGQ
jgi:UDP-N-acetyl-D-glucosamine dehydrogenase